jgi:hypothetical protein
MSTSEKRLASNRLNAQRSTGPRTVAGKRTVSRNAISHGIHARDVVAAPSERAEDFEALRSALVEDLLPEGTFEELLVEQIAAIHWRLRRVLRAEAGAVSISSANALAYPIADRENRLKESIRDLAALGGGDNFYGSGMATTLRDRIHESAVGQAYLLVVLRAARETLTAQKQLEDGRRRHLTDVVGPSSELGSLLADPDPKSPDSPPLSPTSLLEAIDRRTAAAEARMATLREREEQPNAALIAQHSLPPDGAADMILRYEKTLGNTLARALNDLIRLQARRRAGSGSPNTSK